MTNEHDAGYKNLFSCPELVRDLILGFIPDEWLHSLDYNTLEKISGSYVTDDYRYREDDVVWRVKVGGEYVYLYLLIEFQGSVDLYMAVRMMVYVGLLYQDLIKRGDVMANKQLPPVLPIVFYHGDAQWTAARDIAQLIPKTPGLVSGYIPQMEYLLIDSNDYPDEELAELKNLVAVLLRVERPAHPRVILDVIDLLMELLDGKSELKRLFAVWIRTVLLRQNKFQWAFEKIRTLRELKMGWAERIEVWEREFIQKGMEKGIETGIQKGLEQGIIKGIEQGIEQGEAKALRVLLNKRFGPLPLHVEAQIGSATAPEIEEWLQAVLSAHSLNEIFRN